MNSQEFWICKRCGNKEDGPAPTQSQICWTCIELVMSQAKTRPLPIFKFVFAVLCFCAIVVLGASLIQSLLEPHSELLARYFELVLFFVTLIPTVGSLLVSRCPCCRTLSFNTDRCRPCGFEYQEK